MYRFFKNQVLLSKILRINTRLKKKPKGTISENIKGNVSVMEKNAKLLAKNGELIRIQRALYASL